MANTGNLMTAEELNSRKTPAERQAQARKAGLASGEARRKRRALREVFDVMLTTKVSDEEIVQMFERAGVPEAERTYQNALVLSAMLKAGKGDIEASRYIRDSIGEKPTEQYRLSVGDKPIKALDLTGMSDEELEALADSVDD